VQLEFNPEMWSSFEVEDPVTIITLDHHLRSSGAFLSHSFHKELKILANVEQPSYLLNLHAKHKHEADSSDRKIKTHRLNEGGTFKCGDFTF